MRKSTITAKYKADVKTVWDIVTDNTNYTWRSDLDRIEILEDGKSFVEYTKQGYQTRFAITCKEPYERYAFDMENDNFTGHWTGLFSSTPSGGTQIVFTEELQIKNAFVELLSYIAMPLKTIQNIYAADLRKALGE